SLKPNHKGVSPMKRSHFQPRTVLRSVVAALLVFSLAIPSIPQDCGFHCGTERWVVKTLTDTTVNLIDLDPVQKSIQWLRTRAKPHPLPRKTRLVGIETMTFKVKGVVLSFKKDPKDSVPSVARREILASLGLSVNFR